MTALATDQAVDLRDNLKTPFLRGDDQRRKLREHSIEMSGFAETSACRRAAQFEGSAASPSGSGSSDPFGPSDSPEPTQIRAGKGRGCGRGFPQGHDGSLNVGVRAPIPGKCVPCASQRPIAHIAAKIGIESFKHSGPLQNRGNRISSARAGLNGNEFHSEASQEMPAQQPEILICDSR